MKKFVEIKAEILKRVKQYKTCIEEYKLVYQSETMQELAKFIKSNFNWCCTHSVLDVELINTYEEEFAKVEIYANKSIDCGYVIINCEIEKLSGTAIAFMYGNAIVKSMRDNSIVTKMYNNAIVKEMCDNSIVLEMWHYSTVLRMCDKSTVKEMYDNSTVTLMRNTSTVTCMWCYSTVVMMYDNSTVKVMYDDSTVRSMCENSTVKSMNDNSYISTYNYIKCKLNDNSIMRVTSIGNIYTRFNIEKQQN